METTDTHNLRKRASHTDMDMKKVLIVEDNGILAMSFAKLISDIGCHVIGVVDSSLEALLQVKRLRPHAVLLNISHMKGWGDITVAKRIQDTYGVPVIFMTAHMDYKIRRLAMEVSSGRLLDKPFDDLDLKRNLELALYPNIGFNGNCAAVHTHNIG